MFAKAILILCAQAVLAKVALSQCIGAGLTAACGLGTPALACNGLNRPLACDGLGSWAGRSFANDGFYPSVTPAIDFSPTCGGGFPVTSASSFAPAGISLASENFYEGILDVVGELPFVGTVGLDGVFPTAGAGVVNHACGNGVSAMVSENTAPTPAVAPFRANAPGIVSLAPGYRAGWPGAGCGCAL